MVTKDTRPLMALQMSMGYYMVHIEVTYSVP